MPTTLNLTVSDNLNSPGLKDQAGFRGRVLTQIPVQVAFQSTPNDRLTQIPVQVIVETFAEFDLRDLLNYWQDSLQTTAIGPISLNLSDTESANWKDAVNQQFSNITLLLSDSETNNWNDSVIAAFAQFNIILSDSLNFWSDSVTQGFPLQTEQFSDSLNFWKDIAGFKGRALTQLPVQAIYQSAPPNLRLTQLAVQVIRPTNSGQQPRISIMT